MRQPHRAAGSHRCTGPRRWTTALCARHFCRARSSSFSNGRRFHRPVTTSWSPRSSVAAPCDGCAGTPAAGPIDLGGPGRGSSAEPKTSTQRTKCRSLRNRAPARFSIQHRSGRSRSSAVITSGRDRWPRSPCEIGYGRLRNVDSPRWWPRMTGLRMRASGDTQRGGRAPGGTATRPPVRVLAVARAGGLMWLRGGPARRRPGQWPVKRPSRRSVKLRTPSAASWLCRMPGSSERRCSRAASGP